MSDIRLTLLSDKTRQTILPPWFQAASLVGQENLTSSKVVKEVVFSRLCEKGHHWFWLIISLSPSGDFKGKKLSESSKKLQRLLAQQRAIQAQIQNIEAKEQERKEKAVANVIRRHKLTRFDPEGLDQMLTLVVAELEKTPASKAENVHGG